MMAGTATLEREAARQAVGRISVADAVAIATAASELGTSDAREGANVAPNRVLARALRNPQGIGWSLTPADLRPVELAAMRGLVTRAYAYGLAAR